MQTGFLLVETREDLPELVRIRGISSAPQLDDASPARDRRIPRLRYAARFDDIDAATMHAHNAMRHSLVDLEQRLYRADVRDAVAAADSLALPHRRLHLDPALADDPRFAARLAQHEARHRRNDEIWNAVGALALVILTGLLLLGF